ncbi:MAG: hypothetical protein QNJ54_13970 [Prochloraceae cyanobacterium]|nr:hypothetical protein [Prochloraceae cyanobacterium]
MVEQFNCRPQLPPYLKNNHWEEIELTIKQWSQIVAWSWLVDYTVFTEDKQKSSEMRLKRFFTQTLKNQAQYNAAAKAYGDPHAMAMAEKESKILKKLIEGAENIEGLTLSDVFEELTGTQCICKSHPDFMELFRFEVILGYVGSIREDEEEKARYVATLAYTEPPRFSPASVTEGELMSWMRDNSENHLPPPFIPLATT